MEQALKPGVRRGSDDFVNITEGEKRFIRLL